MAFKEAKVYFDGSHYIAIPKTTNPAGKIKRKKPEKEIEIEEEQVISDDEEIVENLDNKEKEIQNDKNSKAVKIRRKTTLKKEFERVYKGCLGLSRKSRYKAVCEQLKPLFNSSQECEEFVKEGFERKQRNLIVRRVRLYRKINMQELNYFCTFTYDDKKLNEEQFRKKLKRTLENLSTRRNWEYIGVWERSPKNKRLHFHALVYVPEDNYPGEFVKKRDFSFHTKKMQEINENTFFLEKFGRNDFEEINTTFEKTQSATYIVKYLEKTEERIVCSKGMFQYFISDILDEDVLCRTGQEDRKLILYDQFKCICEGEIIGPVSKEVIKQMPKAK